MQQVKNYAEAVEFILSIPKFASKIGTDNLVRLLGQFSNPETACPTIHVAGTNGKGSTCAFMQSILQEAGYKVGLFTSPHLVKINERIQINGEAISDEAFFDLFLHVQENLLKVTSYENTENDIPYPSFFEMMFLLAAVYFSQQQVDVVIYETGMGGRLDATNVLKPEVSVITSVGMDHMQYLGETLEQIAFEKAGIIKENVPIVAFFRNAGVEQVIRNQAKQCNAPVLAVEKSNYVLDKITAKTIDFSIDSEYYKCGAFQIPKTALYQVENAVLAVIALTQTKFCVSTDHIRKGLLHMHWSGRMEEVLPDVYIDGAHNEEAVILWKESVQKLFSGKKHSLLFAVANDKDYETMITHICKDMSYQRIYLTMIPGARQTEVDLVKKQFAACTQDEIVVIEDTKTAFFKALNDREDDTYLFLVGSLYLVGAVKAYISDKGEYYDKL